jgi:hypothetical protein
VPDPSCAVSVTSAARDTPSSVTCALVMPSRIVTLPPTTVSAVLLAVIVTSMLPWAGPESVTVSSLVAGNVWTPVVPSRT